MPLDDQSKNNVTQSGNAGKNLVQVGRDYIKYIQYNVDAGNWPVVCVNLFVVFLVVYVVISGVQSVTKTFSTQSSTPEDTQKTASSPVDNTSSPSIPTSVPSVEPTPTFNTQEEKTRITCKEGDGNQKEYRSLDTVIQVACSDGGIRSIKLTNYSTNAIEFSLNAPGFDKRPGLLIPDRNFTYDKLTIEPTQLAKWKSYPVKLTEVTPTFWGSVAEDLKYILVNEITLVLTTYPADGATKEVTFSCKDSFRVWGIQFQAQCVPPGTRAEYTNTFNQLMSLQLPGSSSPPVMLEPHNPRNLRRGGSGTLKSSSETVTVILTAHEAYGKD